MRGKPSLIVLLLAIAALTALFFVGRCCSGKGSSQRTIMMSHSFGQQHPIHKFLAGFAGQLKEDSKGRFTVEIYDSSQLGAEPQFAEQIRLGVLDGGIVSNQMLSKFAPEFLIFQYPYVWQNEASARDFLNKTACRKLADILKKADVELVLCTSLTNGMNGLYFSSDLERMSFNDPARRLYLAYSGAPLCVKYFTAIGLLPVPIAKGEVYSSLQMKMISAGENTLPGVIGSKHFETAKLFVATEHTPAVFYLVFNSDFMKSLSAGEKLILKNAWERAKKEFEKLASPDLVKLAERNGIKYQILSAEEAGYLKNIAEKELKKSARLPWQALYSKSEKTEAGVK